MANEHAPYPEVGKARGLPRRVSLVWILPLAAIIFAVVMIWLSYREQGPLVTIEFDKADGVQAGETPIRRHDVDIGIVESVRLSDDFESVIVAARIHPQVASQLDESARFWIVNARINTTEISGLGTLLSGAFIEVDWDSEEQGERKRKFIGTDEPPLTKRGTPGRRLTLSAEEAGYIYVGSPVFLRQIEVGRVERRRLSDGGKQVLFDIFVEAPYHNHIYKESRFFAVSGVEAELNSEGARVRVESIAALFTGGIAFETPIEAPDPQRVMFNDAHFKLYDNRSAARDTLFEDETDMRFRYMAEFEGSVKGLRAGASVEFNGLVVGRVVSVSVDLPDGPTGRTRVYAVMQLQPRRFGLVDVSPAQLREVLDRYVAKGMRAQLATGNLLTGSLVVKLVNKPNPLVARIDDDASPYPALPSTRSNVETVTRDVETLIKNLSQLPLQSLVESATELLVNAGNLVSSPDIQSLPAQLGSSLNSIASTADRIETASKNLPALLAALTSASRNADDVLSGLSPDSEIYIELAATARELREAAQSIASFAEYLEDNPNAVFTGR